MKCPTRPCLNLIYARSLNGVIGRDGELPDWRIPGDLKRFKELTQDSVVIMGRKTWDSLPASSKPLPGRVNIIVTSKHSVSVSPLVYFVHSMQEAYELALEFSLPMWVMGGVSLYKHFESKADYVYETIVMDSLVRGDVFYTYDGRPRRQISEQLVRDVVCENRLTHAFHRIYQCLGAASQPCVTGQALDEFDDFHAAIGA